MFKRFVYEHIMSNSSLNRGLNCLWVKLANPALYK